MKKLIVIAQPEKADVAEAVKEFLRRVDGRAEVVGVEIDGGEVDLARAKADMVLVFGGDGSILRAARRMGRNQMPTLGVNFGKLGFLAEYDPEFLMKNLDIVLYGKHPLSKRMMLKCTVRKSEKPVGQGILGLNDVVFFRGGTPQLINLDLGIDREDTIRFSGDGLIVATPVGSTAHSLAAGGPIVHPEAGAFVITPVCPHTLGSRPVVVTGRSSFCITLAPDSPGNASVSVDGQIVAHLEQGKDVDVEIKRAGTGFLLVRRPDISYYELLTRKLSWGGQLRYGEDYD